MKLNILIAGVACALLGTAASAATLFTQGAPTGAMTSPGSVSYQFAANAGAGLTSFTLNGFNSLDGEGNGYTDVFTLKLNGTDILSGSYNLGGGGYDITYFAPVGSSVSVSTPGSWQGGTGLFSIPLGLAQGTNTLTLSYSGNAQGLGDEGWGVSNLSVTGGVPEPATWTMLIAGFGFVGASLRRRKPALATLS
ncbi:PEP-CTERM sorting domain-containing protein [Sandaracinobacter neustonicus]|uniref:PEP-CTERM sorting domain-containing protein n=1 Tax=Sandaracinobacter neustonicus TaxID=1715348 RepID=A0A501XKT4_9SPHN|nr:PEPxxWA-CTERM sorting domain-containing protein [Sandaracinobacter neustonicus]TPE61180.1 PEP-CTERM sorting domain-containing protein [Sandaracinobacter neustonicus]